MRACGLVMPRSLAALRAKPLDWRRSRSTTSSCSGHAPDQAHTTALCAQAALAGDSAHVLRGEVYISSRSKLASLPLPYPNMKSL